MFDLIPLIKAISYFGLFGIIFAETGLLIGFFLPGDSLLITAGLLAAQGYLSLPLLVTVCSVAAILGNLMGYFVGQKVGPLIFIQPRSRWFRPEYVEKTRAYFEVHGAKTIILARFIPIVRTFVSTFAGVSGMSFGRFALHSIVGGLLWGVGLPCAGYFLGNLIPDLDKYVLFLIAFIIVVSFIPVGLEYRKHRRSARTPVEEQPKIR